MISDVDDKSIVLAIAYLDPDLNAEGQHLDVHIQPDTIWLKMRQGVRSPAVAAVAVLITLLILAANLHP